MNVVFIQLLTGEQFLVETEEDVRSFLKGPGIIDFDRKSFYRVIGRVNQDGTTSFGFVRMDNDFFPPADRISFNGDKIVMTYSIEPNSDLYRGFEAAKVKESARASGLVLVK